MKDTLASVVILCIVLVIVTALCTFSFIVHLIGSQLALLPAITPAMVLALIPAALTQMFLPAVLISLFLALIRMRRRPGILLVSYLALGALAFGVLFAGPQLAAAPLASALGRVRAESTLAMRDLEEPGRLVPLRNAYLYFEKRSGPVLSGGAHIDLSRPAPRLTFFDRAAIELGAGAPRLAAEPPPRVIPLPPRAEEAAPFSPDAATRTAADAFASFNERFLALSGARQGEFLVVCLLLVALVLASSFFLRITRWPLANIFIALLVLALILALYNFLVRGLLGEALKLTGAAGVLALVPNVFLAFCAGLFFLLDFVLLPEKKKELPSA